MTLDELAARCEQATGPDRELDVAIGLTGKFYIAEPRYPGATPLIGYVDEDGSRVEPGNGAADSLVPTYTASLDAAMTLVPEGAWWELDASGSAKVVVEVTFGDPPEVEHDKRSCKGQAATPALAICAAALRAEASP